MCRCGYSNGKPFSTVLCILSIAKFVWKCLRRNDHSKVNLYVLDETNFFEQDQKPINCNCNYYYYCMQCRQHELNDTQISNSDIFLYVNCSTPKISYQSKLGWNWPTVNRMAVQCLLFYCQYIFAYLFIRALL